MRAALRTTSGVRLALAAAIATLAVDLAMPLLGIELLGGWFVPIATVSFLYTQVGLHAVWVTLGTARWSWRAASLLPAVALVWWYMSGWRGDREFLAWIGIGQWSFVALVLGTLRLAGFRLERASADQTAHAVRRTQFSTRDLVIFVTLSAFCLGLILQLARRTDSWDLTSLPIASGLFGGAFALATLGSTLATLVPRRALVPIAIVWLIQATVGLGLEQLFGGGDWRSHVEAALFFALPAVLQTVGLLVYRRRGWHVRRRGAAAPRPDGAVIPADTATAELPPV